MADTTIHVTVPDVFAALPPKCRRVGGRNHEPYWTGATSPSTLTDFGSATFTACSIAPRTMVTFGRRRSTFSFNSVKTSTVQQGDGPWEFALAMHLEVLPDVSDYQMHNLSTVWTVDGSVLQEYGPDAIWADVAGYVTCAEVKASAAYFALPETKSLCDAAEAGLATYDVRFARVTGDALQEDRRQSFNVKRAFLDRTTPISRQQRDAARNRLAGGDTALGRLAEIVGARPGGALRTINALLVRGHAAYDLTRSIDPDMPIKAAPTTAVTPAIRAIGA